MRKGACVLSGYPVHPGHGKRYVPTLVQSTKPVLTFFNNKTRQKYLRKKNPREVRWTVTYRRVHKKAVSAETIRKRAKKVRKVQRPILGADLEEIQRKKAQRGELRAASKEAALKELAERKAKKEAEKKKNPRKPAQAYAPLPTVSKGPKTKR
eukprot:NODE_6277_length_587_cov_469.288104_g5866_i0.p2 GENE.NODE_6277_length_587_cov_469.288104_g5866_i0~~NODE_6277_length_587_cov_469.288104_g5866_i0.p2  ORF type:complete len:153 (-),score=35.52 NODE_6277_length_587_cov_469.288104_g5866_i0:80-538(-)